MHIFTYLFKYCWRREHSLSQWVLGGTFGVVAIADAQAPPPAVVQLLAELADGQRSADHPKRAASLRHAYPKLGLPQRRGLLLHCATNLGTDGATARAAVQAFAEADDAAAVTSSAACDEAPPVAVEAVTRLRAALAPKHEALFAAVAREVCAAGSVPHCSAAPQARPRCGKTALKLVSEETHRH